MSLSIAAALFVLGLILSFVGWIWGLVQAFNEETVWGVLYLLVPFASLVFYIKKWQNKKIRKTFWIGLTGWGMILLGSLVTAIFGSNNSTKTSFNPSESQWNVSAISTEQSPSYFPTDFHIPPSPTQQSSPVSEASPKLSPKPVALPNLADVSAKKYDFKQWMILGYAASQQGDYQTALINFNRALRERPDNTYATNAIRNTNSAIAQNKVK